MRPLRYQYTSAEERLRRHSLRGHALDIEGVVVGNTSARAGGFHSFGMWKGGGPEPS